MRHNLSLRLAENLHSMCKCRDQSPSFRLGASPHGCARFCKLLESCSIGMELKLYQFHDAPSDEFIMKSLIFEFGSVSARFQLCSGCFEQTRVINGRRIALIKRIDNCVRKSIGCSNGFLVDFEDSLIR